MGIELECGALSVKGEDHEENEDMYVVEEDLRLFAVADGVSIPKGGGEAAKLATRVLPEKLREHRDLLEAMLSTNDSVLEAREKGRCGYTTLTALWLPEERPYRGVLCWVGDSPAYLVRNGRISELTKEKDAHGSVLLQAIGEEVINPHSTELIIERNDVFLLLTDGVSGVLSTNEMLLAVMQSENAESICTKLIEFARKKRAEYRDDMTAVVVIIR